MRPVLPENKGPCRCRQNCGQPVHAKGLAFACYNRWLRAGRPAAGPPAPLTVAEAADRRWPDRATSDCEPDAFDLACAREMAARREPDRRVQRAWPFALDFARAVQSRDACGSRLLFGRITDAESLLLALAEVADLSQLAQMCAAPGTTTVEVSDAAA